MNANDIKTIHELLMDRVVPKSAREGVAIAALAQRLVSHFAKDHAPQHDTQQAGTPAPASDK